MFDTKFFTCSISSGAVEIVAVLSKTSQAICYNVDK